MQHFKNAFKIYHKQNFNCLVFIKSDRPVCNHLNVNFIKKKKKKKLLSKPFFLKKIDFCIFNPKNFEVKENCSKTLLSVCPLKCTYIGKNHFDFISVWSEIMSLKSDQLELGVRIFKKKREFPLQRNSTEIDISIR